MFSDLFNSWTSGHPWLHVVIFGAGGASLKAFSTLYPKLADFVVQHLSRKRGFTTSGYWVGKYTTPGFSGAWIYEVYRLIQLQEEVQFYLFAYSKKQNPTNTPEAALTRPKMRCPLWRGTGVLQQGILSAYYLNTDRHSYESGTFVLKLERNTLKGKFFQTDVAAPGSPSYICDYAYILYRAKLPIMARVKMFFRRPPFSDADAPVKLYDEANAHANEI